MHVCKLAEIPTQDTISGQDACKPGRPARLPMDKIKLHYVVHYTFRGVWDVLVPKEKEEELGKIEVYQCQMCPRRFRNNHNKKQYPGRGSMVCHLATEHGQLLKQMRADKEMDMQSEIEALDKHEKGKLIEMGIPDVPDNELYVAKESYMWKFEQSQLAEKRAQENDPNAPKIVPKSKTELAESANNSHQSNYNRGRQVFEMHKCKLANVPTEDKITGQDACTAARPANLTMDKIKLHYVVHYTFRGTWDYLVPKEKEEEKGKIEVYQCLMCQRRFRNNHNKKQYPGRGSMVCHLATEHGQLLKAMRADDKVDMQEEIEALNKHENGKFLEMGIPDVPDNELYVAKESYMWKFENEDKLKNQEKNKKEEPKKSESKDPKIVPLSKTEIAEKEAEKKSKSSSAKEELKTTAKAPEPTRGKRPKPSVKSKWSQWMSDNEDEEPIEPPKLKKAKAGPKKGKK